MNVISVDFSKRKTGIFTQIGGVEESFLLKPKYNVTQGEALFFYKKEFENILSRFNFHFGIIERYGFNIKNKYSIIPMCEIGGVIKLIFAIKKIPLIDMPVQTWKMLTINFKNKEKYLKEYLKLVQKKYNKVFKSSDEADAFMMYQALRIIAKKTSRLTDSMIKIRKQLNQIIKDFEGSKNNE